MIQYKTLPSPIELKNAYSLNAKQKAYIENTRQEISHILDGSDSRILMIVGPCSIHDIDSVKEYAHRLKSLANEVSDCFMLIMRTYFEKPRTILGWKGFLYDPDLDNSHNVEKGLKLTRNLLLDLIQMEVPTAAEFLEPISCAYLDDLISWGCIGARTAASQTHRQMASGLSMPVAFKNTTDGNVEAAIHGILSSAHCHSYMGINQNGLVAMVHTHGNSHGHLVLRGSDQKTNYDPESISHALKKLNNVNLPLRLLIDCSHGNSKRLHEQQSQVFQSVISQIVEGNRSVKGVLLESHLNAGNQQLINVQSLKYAVSLTDPCLDWSTTENLIRWAFHKVKNELSIENKSNLLIDSPHLVFQKT